MRQRLFWDSGILPVAVLLIVGITLGWVAYRSYNQVMEAEFRLLEAHARNADAQVSGALLQVTRVLNQIATSPPGAGQTFRLMPYPLDVDGLHSLLLTDARGRVTNASRSDLLGRSVAQEPWFGAARNSASAERPHMSRPARGLFAQTTLTFALPVFDEKRQFSGMAAVIIDYYFFLKLLARINPDDSASMTVIFNDEGDILFRRGDPERYFGFNIVSTSTVYGPHRAAGTPVTRHIGPSAIDGKTRLFLVRQMGERGSGLGMGLILSRQLDEVLAEWRHDVEIYALIFAFTAVVVTFLASVAVRRKRQVIAAKAFTDQLIATANVMLVGLDAQGRISMFNQTAERLSGFSRKELLGEDWLEALVTRSAANEVAEALQGFATGGALPHTMEYAIRTKGGQERIIAWQNSVIESPRAAICFGIDVSEHRQMEAERERFVAMVSHEFRTPLATIDGAIQNLKLNARHDHAGTHKRYQRIQQAVERLTALLDDYLAQERLGRVRHAAKLEYISTTSLLHDLQQTSAALSPEHRICVDAAAIEETLYCDSGLIQLSLRVLADNAVKYTPPGSEIRLHCRRAQGQGIEFVVSDNGPGIPPEELPHLFNKFFRGRQAMQQSGSGIGLHLARSVVESHGGRLTASNLPGGGAEFHLWLPDGGQRSTAAQCAT